MWWLMYSFSNTIPSPFSTVISQSWNPHSLFFIFLLDSYKTDVWRPCQSQNFTGGRTEEWGEQSCFCMAGFVVDILAVKRSLTLSQAYLSIVSASSTFQANSYYLLFVVKTQMHDNFREKETFWFAVIRGFKSIGSCQALMGRTSLLWVKKRFRSPKF